MIACKDEIHDEEEFMLKKFFGIFFALMLISSSCFAMKFSQPEEIGRIHKTQAGAGSGGFEFPGATFNEGDFYRTNKWNQNNTKTYGKGIARFGELYIYYDAYKNQDEVSIGSNDLSNTIKIYCSNDRVFKIANDGNIQIYALIFMSSGARQFYIIGTKSDGSFVKYIDSSQIVKQYIGEVGLVFGDFKSDGSVISISYQTQGRSKTSGEFRFKWDDAAQWFSVEQIIY